MAGVSTTAQFSAPIRMPFTPRQGLRIAQRRSGTELLPALPLAWQPAVVSAAAAGPAVLESLIVHDDGELNERALELVRSVASFAVSCSFCVGINFDGCEPRRQADAGDSG